MTPDGLVLLAAYGTACYEEAAALARVSPATIRRWYRSGYLDALQVGRGATIRIPPHELEKLAGDSNLRPSG